jgi:hypothetical protein
MRMTIEIVPESLRRYVGLRFHIADDLQRSEHMRFTFSNVCLAGSRTPMGIYSRNGILHCDEMRDYLYQSEFGKIERPYQTGTYPLLENYVDSVIEPGMNDGQKVIALSQHMLFELPKQYEKVPVFLYGESDQETLLKGGGHCSCKGRLLSACCQIIGIAARPVMQWTWRDRSMSGDPDQLLGGHTVAEAFIDARWVYLFIVARYRQPY